MSLKSSAMIAIVLLVSTPGHSQVEPLPAPTAFPEQAIKRTKESKYRACDRSAYVEALENVYKDADRTSARKVHALSAIISHGRNCGFETENMKADVRDASEIVHGVPDSIAYLSPHQMQSRLSHSCVREARANARSQLSVGSIDGDLTDLEVCASLAGEPYKKIQNEIADLKSKARIEIDKRRAACKEATVDETDMGPPRNQGSIGWCYAHAAADVISHAVKKRISAIDLALKYNDSGIFRFRKKLFNRSEFAAVGGHVDSAFQAALPRGFCRDENLRAENYGKPARTSSLIADYMELEKIKDAFDQKKKSEHEACDEAAKITASIAPTLPREILRTLLKDTSREVFFSKFRKFACGERIEAPNDLKVQTTFLGSERMKAVDRALNDNLPVGVSFWANLVGIPGWSAHASTIVGRRFNEELGECEYRLRNTWGTRWGENGYRWISSQELSKNLLATMHLTK